MVPVMEALAGGAVARAVVVVMARAVVVVIASGQSSHPAAATATSEDHRMVPLGTRPSRPRPSPEKAQPFTTSLSYRASVAKATTWMAQLPWRT